MGREHEGHAKVIEARLHALMMLYGIELTGQTPELALDRFYGAAEGDLDPPATWDETATRGLIVDPSVRGIAEELVRGVVSRRDEIDKVIAKVSTNWRIERMALVDRNILRLGAFELFEKRVPRKVAINEAIELAKRFGTREAGGFVNGVLDRIPVESA